MGRFVVWFRWRTAAGELEERAEEFDAPSLAAAKRQAKAAADTRGLWVSDVYRKEERSDDE